MFSANTAVARSGESASHSARLGAAPWHLSILSTALMVFELGMGTFSASEELASQQLQVQEYHVTRAYKLLERLQDVSKMLGNGCHE